ncbi:MAG TPA: PotD/PotF family extracellular solute-binding protein [Conexibacter sp.]|nr:PotD/PotF family extracellular solute-binding protein [Conexibacter sp.]
MTVLSWVAYVTPDIQRQFKKDTGITLRGVPAESDQDMFTKVKAGGGGQYDIVMANCGWCPLYYDNGLTEPFDLSEVRGSDQLYPDFVEGRDLPYVRPDGKVLIYPNMWGALGLAWNTSVDYQPEQPYSWNALWSDQVPEGKVMMAGAGEDFLATAGLALGVDRNAVYSMRGAELRRAEEKLKQLMPFQWNRSVDPDFRSAIRSERAWIGESTTLGSAPILNAEAGREIAKVVIPEEGSLGWIDGPQLVKGAKRRANALKFMEWFGTNQWCQDYLFDEYSNAQCNKAQVDRVLNSRPDRATRAEQVQANHPEVAKQLAFQRQPDDLQAWTAAYDRVLAAG